MTKLILDIDGVINAIAPAKEWHDYRSVPLRGAYGDKITWSPTMVKHLRKLNMPVTWNTAWTDYAPSVFAPVIGLGVNRPYLEPLNGLMDYPTILWKREAMEKFIRDDPCQFVWLDDEMRLEDMLWAARHNGLALRPPIWDGITREQIREIEAFSRNAR